MTEPYRAPAIKIKPQEGMLCKKCLAFWTKGTPETCVCKPKKEYMDNQRYANIEGKK